MRKISEFMGKPVLSLYESTTLGIINNVIFDKGFKKLKFICLFKDNEFQEEYIFNVNDVYSYGENAIVLKNIEYINLKTEVILEDNNPINNLVYTTLGKYVGKVNDIEIDDKNNITNIILDTNMSINNNQVITSGKDAMFIQDETKEVKLSSFRHKSITKSNDDKIIKVEIQSQDKEEQIVENEVNTETKNESDTENLENITEEKKPRKKIDLTENKLPLKLSTTNNFLIGRKVNRNIYSFNHEIIIKKNTKITDKVILKAKSHSKLKELSLYSE